MSIRRQSRSSVMSVFFLTQLVRKPSPPPLCGPQLNTVKNLDARSSSSRMKEIRGAAPRAVRPFLRKLVRTLKAAAPSTRPYPSTIFSLFQTSSASAARPRRRPLRPRDRHRLRQGRLGPHGGGHECAGPHPEGLHRLRPTPTAPQAQPGRGSRPRTGTPPSQESSPGPRSSTSPRTSSPRTSSRAPSATQCGVTR